MAERKDKKQKTVSRPVKVSKFDQVRQNLEQAKTNQKHDPSPENHRQVKFWQDILAKLESGK